MKSVFVACMMALGEADLRMASQPTTGGAGEQVSYKVKQRNNKVPFLNQTALYIEPSTFNYNGLIKQRQKNFDNFLRSNIDNEQAKRNANNEPGLDHMPFRTFEGSGTTSSGTAADAPAAGAYDPIPATAPGPAIYATPGVSALIPLRWNNPHAAEIEVNVWLMKVTDGPVVVPVRKPTCSGEGHQDNVFAFTIPSDFNTALATRVPGFSGCKTVGDCVLQVYAHSVETRMYSIGSPLVVAGNVAANNAGGGNIIAAQQDVAWNVNSLPNIICLGSNNISADIANAVPQAARLVSDVFNSAYQSGFNDAYSPYAGQQPTAISQNMQYAMIYRMVTANRGELGKAYLKKFNNNISKSVGSAYDTVRSLESEATKIKKNYEAATNRIIAAIGKNMDNTDATMTSANGGSATQLTETCFRCAEVGAVVAKRLTTTTYIPSFTIPAGSARDAAKAQLGKEENVLQDLIDTNGNLLIYKCVVNRMMTKFLDLANKYQLGYQPAALKTTLTTPNVDGGLKFKKRDANGKADWGIASTTTALAGYAQAQHDALVGQGTGTRATKAAAVLGKMPQDILPPTGGPATAGFELPEADLLADDDPNGQWVDYDLEQQYDAKQPNPTNASSAPFNQLMSGPIWASKGSYQMFFVPEDYTILVGDPEKSMITIADGPPANTNGASSVMVAGSVVMTAVVALLM